MTPKQATAALPMDDPDLTDKEATFETLRVIVNNQELVKARLDGLTEALAAISGELAALKAAAASSPAAAAARPAAASGGGPGEIKTIGISAVYNATKTKKDGGTYTKPQVKLANGWERDIRREDMKWFEARVGQEVTVKAVKNERGYETLYPV